MIAIDMIIIDPTICSFAKAKLLFLWIKRSAYPIDNATVRSSMVLLLRFVSSILFVLELHPKLCLKLLFSNFSPPC